MNIFHCVPPRSGILYGNSFPHKIVNGHSDLSLKLFELQGPIKKQFVAFFMLFKKCQLREVQKCIFWAPGAKMGPKNARATPGRELFSAVDPKPLELQG